MNITTHIDFLVIQILDSLEYPKSYIGTFNNG